MNPYPVIAAAVSPVKVFEGIAQQGTPLPYATFQYIGAQPINDLEGHVADQVKLQIDVWAKTGSESRQLAKSIRLALNSYGYVTYYESVKEQDYLHRTLFHFSFIE